MPGFTTHWLVASRSIDETPDYISNGYDKYKRAINVMHESLKVAISNILRSKASFFEFTKSSGIFEEINADFEKHSGE